MFNRLAILSGLLIAMATCSAWAVDKSDYDSSPFGINGLKYEFNPNTPGSWDSTYKAASAMTDAGIYWDRDGVSWSKVEPEKGKWDWSIPDKIAEIQKKTGIQNIILLMGRAAWRRDMPVTPEHRAEFANYVYQMVKRYKGTFKIYEIWNEPNISQFWRNPNVKDYTLLLKESYLAAKRADPNCVILAASTSMADLTFVRGIRKYGGWDYCDGISIHPYSSLGSPVSQKLDKLLRMINSYIQSTGKPKSLWITEMGWQARGRDWMEPQAIYMFESFMMAMANGVKKLCWFDLIDWDEKWGITKSCDPMDPKPSYYTYKLMTKLFGSPGPAAKFAGYLKMPEGAACYVFRKQSGECLLAIWTSGDDQAIQLPQRTGLSAVDIFNKSIDSKDGKIPIGWTPIIVTGADFSKIGHVSLAFNPYLEKKGENLLNNGSLNTVFGRQPGWWEFGRYDQSAKDGKGEVSSDGRNGSKCVTISKSGKAAAWDSSPYPVEAGKKYKLTAWVRTLNATGSTRIALFWCDGNQQQYVGDIQSEPISGTHDWTKVTIEGTAPEDATFVRVNLISENNSGTAWFDDIEVPVE